jgi:hypothetical protein
MSDIGMNSDVDIGILPISEWRFSVRHICLRYLNKRCRCRMSDIADIEIDVDAHLCHKGTIAQKLTFLLKYRAVGIQTVEVSSRPRNISLATFLVLGRLIFTWNYIIFGEICSSSQVFVQKFIIFIYAKYWFCLAVFGKNFKKYTIKCQLKI